jgi:hypothetical protein
VSAKESGAHPPSKKEERKPLATSPARTPIPFSSSPAFSSASSRENCVRQRKADRIRRGIEEMKS